MGVRGGGGNETAYAVDQAVTTFPEKVADVVGNAKLPMQHGGQQVVAGALVTIEEVELLTCQLLDGEGEVGVGEGLVFQREVPPFCIEGLETVTHHGITENHAVLELLFGDALSIVGMALRTEPIEGATHIELLLCCHVKEGEVEGGAARMSAFLTDIFLGKKYVFLEVGIEIGFHAGIVEVGSPAHEVVNGHLWTISVVDFQAVAQLDDIVTNSAEAVGCLFGEQGSWFQIAVNAVAHEVVGAEVADFQNGIGHDIG